MAQEDQWWSADKPVTTAPVGRGVEIPAPAAKPEPTEGAIPSGYRKSASGGLEPIPGGPADPNAPQNAPEAAEDKPYSQSALDAFDRAINSIDRLKVHPGFGAAVGSAFDPQSIGSYNPVTGEYIGGTKARDFAAELEALKAQVFLPMVQSMKGMGALSNAEGEKLVSAIGALDPGMSEDAFRASIDRIKTDLLAYRNRGLPEGAAPGGAPASPQLQVAQGTKYSTDQDIDVARQLSEAWRGGATLEQLNALSQQLTGQPLSSDATSILQADTNRQQTFAPNTSGTREEGGPGAIAAAGSGLLSGYAANMPEEALAMLSPEAAAKLQAVRGYAQEEYPVTQMGGEILGGVLSPLAKLGGPGLAGAVRGGAIYGGVYGAGEADPTAGIADRLTNAVIGAGLGGAGGYLGGKLAGRIAGNVAPDAIPPSAMPEVMPGGSIASAMPQPAPQATLGEEVGNLVRQSVGGGKKAELAQIRLAELAQVDQNALAAAQRLGLEVPPDVFSDSPMIREAIGLTRSQVGSEASAAWRTVVSDAVDKADDVIRQFDAVFVEGTPAPGAVSDMVKTRLTSERAALERASKAIYDEVDAQVPKQTPVQMNTLFQTLQDVASEVGESGMTAPEKRLLGLIQSGEAGTGDITYGRLIREKNLIGKAIKGRESPYGSLDEATLKRLYGALAEDQLANVERIGGADLRKQLRSANLIYAKERALGERIIKSFGSDIEGSIVGKMRGAITQGAKGDTGEFARLLKVVPEDLRKQTVATAIASAARSSRGAERGGFGFDEFAKLYPNLRANPTVYKQIMQTLGPDADKVMRDLYVVSKRITEARANVLTTGKANQGMLDAMRAEGLAAKVMKSATAQRVAGATMGTISGPFGGALATDVARMMANADKDVIRSAGNLFASPDFQRLMTESATKSEVPKAVVRRAVASRAWQAFAKKTRLPTNVNEATDWVLEALKTTAPIAGTAAMPDQPQLTAPAMEPRQ